MVKLLESMELESFIDNWSAGRSSTAATVDVSAIVLIDGEVLVK